MRSFLGREPLPERVDIVVLGGGVNGVALAAECARARKSVLLVERHDFASGATSRGSRIVYGGLHYLERGEFGMLRESLRGRAALLRDQPHLVQTLDFVFAAAPRSRYSATEIRAALWLYRKLGGRLAAGTDLDPRIDDAEIERLRQHLDPAQRLYSYQDAQCEFPERLVADWLVDACSAGAIARNHLEPLAIRANGGRVRGVFLRDSLTGNDSYVESEWVVNASGPWVDIVRDLTGLAAGLPLITPVRTTHLMLRRFPGAPSIGVQISGARPITIAPWNGMLLVSSACSAFTGDPSQAAPRAEDVSALLASVAAFFPHAGLGAGDIVYSYSGVRPLAWSGGAKALPSGFGSLASPHVLHNHADEGAMGLLSTFGGSLATAASLARATARTMGLTAPPQPAAHIALGGANGVENTLRQWALAVQSSTGIPSQSTEAIARWHGRHAMCVVQTAMHDPCMRMPIVDGRPQLVAQAVEAVAYEHAVTLADILLRRVPMALDQNWSEESTAQAAARIAPALHWSERRMREEIEAFNEERRHFLYEPKNLEPNHVAA
jgi:glycerol-3-phosphate dehydrogenase